MIWLTLISLLLVLVMTYYNWSSNRNSAFLGIYLGLFSLYAFTHYLMVIDFQPNLAAVLFNHLTPFYLLFGPVLFWYTRGVIADDFVFKRTRKGRARSEKRARGRAEQTGGDYGG